MAGFQANGHEQARRGLDGELEAALTPLKKKLTQAASPDEIADIKKQIDELMKQYQNRCRSLWRSLF